MIGRIDLGVGTEALAILSRKVGRGIKGRRQVYGVATVRIVDNHVDGRHDVFRCVVLHGDDARSRARDRRRAELFARTEPSEVEAFREVVKMYWGTSS